MAASPSDLGLNIFGILQGSMDARTWSRVTEVLLPVLDPVNGGDARLHALLLEQTINTGREQRQRAS
jgi:hypothetical protein